jgi:ATP-dependent Clp protease ATP-binding subunit ClpA
MIGKRAEEVLNRALTVAVERKHEFLTVEHVFRALLQVDEIRSVLESCKADVDVMLQELDAYLEKEVPQAAANEAGENENPVATLGVQRLIQRALFQVQSSGKQEIRPEDLLVAIFQAKETWAIHLLRKHNVERLEVVQAISQAQNEAGAESPSKEGESENTERSERRATQDALSLYTQNLNDLAKNGKLDPMVGRQTELERVIQTLCRRRKNNPLLVGEAGVGKTAIAEGLAQRIHAGQVPDLLSGAVVYSLDLGSLLAGTKFRGDFEQRMKKILQSLETKSDRGEFPILFIDEIHNMIGAGAVNGGTLDAANLLKPLLARGALRCIGSTTFAEYRSVFSKDQALARRFQKIDVVEPSQEEAILILNGLKPQFETHHEVRYLPEAIRAAVELSAKHLPDRFLPDKAIDVIDEVGARTRLKRKADHKAGDIVDINKEQIEEMVAQMARIPSKSLQVNQKDRIKGLDQSLKLALYGQDHAVDKIVSSIRLARSGLRTGEKPVGSFLFCGPTGVGKTELSKQLAQQLGIPFLRFDMSEYMEKHTVSRLIGAPPGYVGFEQPGMLTEAVTKSPHAVVLLDEVEKAHPDVWNILLQVMDHGFLTDSSGKKADFRNVILILTSNVGAREMERRSMGFAESSPADVAQKEVERTFSPEFRNRLDAVIYFNPLDPRTMEQVVSKQLVELENQLLQKGVDIEFESDIREWLGKKGYDRRMGARPLARLIQDEIKRPLSEEILFGRLENGGLVRVLVKDDKPYFVIESRVRDDSDVTESALSSRSQDPK